MRDYGTVHSTFWTSPTTHTMTDDGKLLALYLLTGPHTTALGCFRLPDGYVSEDLGWEMERVSKGFDELSRKGYANRCETTKWVLIRSYLKWNPPENPNQVKSLRKLAAQVPDNSSVVKDLISILSDVCGPENQTELFPSLVKGSGTVAKPFRNQEQEQIQEQTQNQTQNQTQSISAEPRGSTPTGLTIPTNTGKQFPIFQEQVDRWGELYPTVDVMAEVRRIVAWAESNTTKRKTERGMLAFVNRWLANAHDSGRGTRKSQPSASQGKTKSASERMREKAGLAK